ncbi:ClpXP protease specificity-enhancing factor [Litoribrevibacter euphylliae]|uniref:ClpXP protease specificity-enhancing factor n=1 Tax=Litoribrevibacter euphylliae TaxID=1834034 RepID=A0ABV7HLH8_9GAMM
MTPSRPYLVRGLQEWMVDNNFTPYIVVDAGVQGVQVPQDFVSDGQIILNISPSAVRGLIISNDAIDFNARFGGVPMRVYVPIVAVLAIYARENGQGMVFGAEPGAPQPDDDPPLKSVKELDDKPDESLAKPKPSLKVVK